MNSITAIEARAFVPEDKVNALVPVVDSSEWSQLVKGKTSYGAFNTSIQWAYKLSLNSFSFKWGVRGYCSPSSPGGVLASLEPKRVYSNLAPSSDKPSNYHPGSNTITLPDDSQLEVIKSSWYPSPANMSSWGGKGNAWDVIRDGIQDSTGLDFGLVACYIGEPYIQDQTYNKNTSMLFLARGENSNIVHLISALSTNSNKNNGRVIFIIDLSNVFEAHILKFLKDPINSNVTLY